MKNMVFQVTTILSSKSRRFASVRTFAVWLVDYGARHHDIPVQVEGSDLACVQFKAVVPERPADISTVPVDTVIIL